MNPSLWLQNLVPLQFLRPHWLWALLALPLLAWLWRRRRNRSSVWRSAVDPHLLTHLLDGRDGRRSRFAAATAVFAYTLAVSALSGPSWRQSEQPLWQGSTPLVIALDLSSRTLAGDLPPTRLAQARAKLATLLKLRDGGQVGLVVYADDAYTVAPLTDDARNVAVFLDALSPDVMPGDGQRGDRAIEWSARLLAQAGFERGEIVLMTDRADAAARRAAAQAADRGYRVSALGLGGEAPTPFQRPDGSIVNVKLDADSLRALAADGDGRYASIGRGDEDLQALRLLAPEVSDAGSARGEKSLAREDNGYWLLPLLMLLALFAFRRRSGMAAVVLLCLCWPALQPAQAQGLWQRPDQAAHERMQQGTQAYRKGEFERAGELYQRAQGADAQYNLGNALARQGRYPDAIAAYDRALKLQPGMADALANKRAVEAAMKRPPPPKGGDGKNSKSQDGKNGQNDGQGQEPQQGGQKKDGQQQKSPSPAPPKPSPPKSPQDRDDPAQPKPGGDSKPSDGEAQRKADAAQRERMQRELARQGKDPAQQPAAGRKPGQETPVERERRLANEAWLKRVPDDPGGLLREKFKIEYERRQMEALRGD
ncbi:VWA domain-containing protein [Lysobacter sp. CA196]|uniref:VWA domain-containing protein n=1 Tax=Lysobacter sp. CA196 TaxID=3455606 RepID=UPI003F8D3512